MEQDDYCLRPTGQQTIALSREVGGILRRLPCQITAGSVDNDDPPRRRGQRDRIRQFQSGTVKGLTQESVLEISGPHDLLTSKEHAAGHFGDEVENVRLLPHGQLTEQGAAGEQGATEVQRNEGFV